MGSCTGTVVCFGLLLPAGGCVGIVVCFGLLLPAGGDFCVVMFRLNVVLVAAALFAKSAMTSLSLRGGTAVPCSGLWL